MASQELPDLVFGRRSNMEDISDNPSQAVLERKRSITPPNQSEIRTITISECEGAAQSLAEAFAADEVARYFLDTEDMSAYSEEYKWKLHCDIIRYVVAAHCYNGVVTTIGPNYESVALWMPPGKNMDDWWTILRSGLWRLYYKLSREGKARFYSEFLPLLHMTKHEILKERDDHSLYLVYVGTRPNARGKGYARTLIQRGLAAADAAGLPTYLECSAKINEPYYRRLGFELRREVTLDRGDEPLRIGIMVREPRGGVVVGSSKLKNGGTLLEQAL